SRKIIEFFDPAQIVPVHSVRVDQKDSARETIDALRATPAGPRIIREWIESPGSFELSVVGDPAGFVSEVEAFLKTRPDREAKVQAMEPVPFLAEPVVTFSLRTDVRWHDGEPFTSRDVVFTYNAIMDDAVASPRKPDF